MNALGCSVALSGILLCLQHAIHTCNSLAPRLIPDVLVSRYRGLLMSWNFMKVSFLFSSLPHNTNLCTSYFMSSLSLLMSTFTVVCGFSAVTGVNLFHNLV